jgi:transcriptional regulator with XRE-family HTH domain
MSIILKTPLEVQQDIAGRFKARRLAMNLTREELASRSGVAGSSLKRFEREGLIALYSLLKIALVLDCLDDFEKIAAGNSRVPAAQSLDDILAKPTPRRRATSKKGGRR